MKLKTLAEKVWSKVDVRDIDECWLWVGAHGKHGHGHLQRGGRGTKFVTAHRAAYELTYGPMSDDLEVCHRCDVRDCCNPKHLFLGTHRENMVDMSRKGRSPHQKLTLNQVSDIRSRRYRGESSKALSSSFGVSTVQIRNITSGRHWR